MNGFLGNFDINNGFSFEGSSTEHSHVLQSADGNYIVSIFGEMFLPTGNILSQQNFETQFLSAFIKDPKTFLLNCEGAFVFVLYDGIKKEVHLITDPFGNLALHYYHSNDLLVFSTSSNEITGFIGNSDRDEHGVFEYFGFGQTLNGKTLFKDIHRLEVASHLRFSNSVLTTSRYFTPSFERKPRMEYPKILNSIKEHLLFNIDIRTRNEHVRSGLSGGFDSRVILAALSHLGRKNVEIFTLGTADSNDIQIAKRLNALVGFRHTIFPYDDKFCSQLPVYWSQIPRISEGGLGIESSPQLAVWTQTAGQARRHLDGHGGPIYRRQILKAHIHKALHYSSIALFVFDRMKSPLLDGDILEKEIKFESEKIIRNSLQMYFDALPEHLTTGDKIDRFYIEQICAHHYGLAGNVEMKFTTLSHPLLSAHSWELLSQFDEGFRAANSVHRYLIHSLCPELEKIPLDNSGFKVPYRGYNYLRYVPQLFERYIAKKISRLSPYIGAFLSLQHSPSTLSMVVSSSPERVREIALSRSSTFSQYFNNSAIEKLDVFDPRMVAAANAKLLLMS